MSESETDLHALRQRQLDAVWDWFVVQGKPKSVEPDAGSMLCRYRGPDGTKCAAGVLIPDELYESRYESVRIEALSERYPKLRAHIGGSENALFVGQLQSAHDWSFDQIETKLVDIARRYHLTVPA